MISFIVIGKNEAKNINRCFKSIRKTIEYNKLTKYEVIYVDSNSTDNSIEIARGFKEIKIFKITGICNAAIARNIGAKESKGDTLFFIDGDMEIIPEFLPLVYSENIGLKYDFVSGQFENNYYDINGMFLYKENYYTLSKDKYQTTTGGLFLIKEKLWNSVNGMKTKYKANEDLDLGLRLSKIGIKLLRKKELLAKHHTISYNDSSRMWKMLFNATGFYRIVLLRDHIKNINQLKNYFRENYTSLLLIFTIIAFLFFNKLSLVSFYLGIILIRSVINMRKDLLRIPNRFIYFILHDISLWFALFLFWPKEINNIEYQTVS